MILVQKLLQLSPTVSSDLSVFCFCAALLGYRYCLAILEDLSSQEKLMQTDIKYLAVSQRFSYDQLLLVLLRRDGQVIRQEYKFFLPHFQAMLSRIHGQPIAAAVQQELSGIIGSEENERRVIRLFFTNYLKKIFNDLKSSVRGPSEMMDESEEGELREDEENPPPLGVTIARMVGEYLSNLALFRVTKEKGMKSLGQHMYDWETTIKEHFYTQLQEGEPLKEESINSFLKKEFLWSKLHMPLSSHQQPTALQ